MQYLNHQVKMVGFLKEKKSKKNSKKNKNENETPDIDFSDSFSILNTDTFADFSDDFIGPRPSKKMIKMQYLNKLEENLVSTKEKLQEEIKPYESELTDINEQIEQLEKKRGTSQRYGPKKVLEINDEIEDLKAKQEKILNDPSYLELLQDIAKIDYYQTKMDDSKILVDYLNDDLELDYDSDYKVNDERLKSMHNKYTINANDSSLYFYEGYEKYNPLLIAQYAYTEAGDNKFEGSVRERDVMMNGSDIGAEYLKAYAYMTQDQRNMYNYLYDSEGFESAEKFLSALKNTTTWKEQAGAYEAREYIISLDFDVDNSKMTSQDFENLSTDYEVIDGKYVKKDLSNVVLKGESAKNILKTFDTGFSDGIDGWCDGIKNLFINGPEASKRFIDDYKNAGILGCLSQTKYFESYNIGQTAGNQFIPTMIGLASGGILGAAGAGSKIGATLLGASAAGNSKQEALRNGYTLEKSWTYGILSGLSEVGTEYFLGSIPGLSSVKGLPSKMASVIAKGGKCEGSEEWLQEYIDAGLRATVLGEKINFDELNGQALEAFKIGCIMGGISNSPAGKLKQEIVYATVGGERIQINLSNEIEGISNRIETNSIENNVISATKKKNITTKLKDTNNVMENINDVNLLEAQYNLSPSEFYQIINEVRTEKGDNSSKVSFNEFYNKLEEKNNIISAVDQEAKNRLVDTNDVSNLTDAEFLKKTYNLTDAEFNTIIKKAKLSNKTGEVPFTEFKKKLDELIDTEIVTSTELQQKINEGLKNKNDVSNTTDKAFLQQSHNLTDDEINSVITNARATNKSNKVSLEEFQKSLAELTEQRLIKNKNESTKINNIEKSINSIIDEAENIFEIKGEYARELKGILDKIKSVNPECLNKFFKELDGISDSKEKIRIVDALCKRINNGAIDIDKISDEDIMCIFNELEFNEGVSYEKIPADKIEYAADLWSEGYEPLRNFLINCMNNDIQTYACCSGHDIDILSKTKLCKPYIMFNLEDSNTIEYIKKICQDPYFKEIYFSRNKAKKITAIIKADDFYNRAQFFSNLESHIDSKDIILSSRSDAIDSIIDYLDSTKNKDSSEVYTFRYDAARNTFDIHRHNSRKTIATKVAVDDLQNFIGGSKELSDVRMKALADKSDLFNRSSNYVKQLILKAYQEGTIDINSMTEQDFDNYIKYIIENNIFKNNGNLELSDFIEEIQATENIYKEFSLDKIFQSLFDGKYGTDQGIFRDKDVREKMKPELMKEYNMSAFDTESLMEGIDSGVGACSYAAAANDIISYFRYRPNDFEKIFGFPLYTINSSGSYAINCARLLADMYIWFNTLENHGYLFYEYDKHKFEYTGLPFSRQNCVWIKTRDIKEWKHKPTIRDYLRSKRRYISCINEYCLWNKEAEAAWNLKFGNGVTLYVEKNNSNIRFIDMDSGETYISWNEGDSHLVKVIGMTDTGFIVSTWGKRCLVLFEDLEKSKGFDVYTTEFLSYDNYT